MTKQIVAFWGMLAFLITLCPSPCGAQTEDHLAAKEVEQLAPIVGEFVKISAGEFVMGSEKNDQNSKPVHRVVISKAFEMGNYEVTQAQWEALMKSKPSSFKGA